MKAVRSSLVLGLLALAAPLVVATPAAAQVQAAQAVSQGPCPTMPSPPAGSPTMYRCTELVFHPSGESLIEPDTYVYYLKTDASLKKSFDKDPDLKAPVWVPYKQDQIIADGDNLWKTGFLDNYWIEEIEEPFENGVKGIHIIYHLEERPRLKGIEYLGSKKVEYSKIEEAMKTKGVTLQVDSFLDMSSIRRVQGIVKELYAEKGYQAAEVTPEIKPIEGAPKLVRLAFNIKEGPEIKIQKIVWDGNQAFSDGTLNGQIKENKPHSWLSWLTQTGTYQEAKFAEDAQKVTDYYHDRGYTMARVGTPQIETLNDSKDGKTRWIQLRIPVDEGQQFKLGEMKVAGSTILKGEQIIPIFKMKPGEIVSRKKLIKGLEEIRKVYGRFGYWEANPIPELCYKGRDCETNRPLQEGADLPNIVDVTIQMNEGDQFYVNRITFLGNTTTHDTVIRREMRVLEGGVFDSEALKDSVKRLNQLGYFKPLEKPEDIDVQPAPGMKQMVNIRLRFEEQNRNTLSFGAGVSQFEGVFGQLGFQTSNFLGRGETLGINLQKGSQARNYQVSFTEPYVFDRPISVGTNVYSRQFTFISQYTEDETGADAVASFSLGGYKRLSLGYSYAKISIHDIGPAYQGLLQDTSYDISKITPAFIYNTVNQPIFPSAGTRYVASVGFAGLGGTANFVTTNLEGIWYVPFTRRTSLGLRLVSQYSRPYGNTTALPVSERAYLGGEYTIRGFDIRSIGPRDALSGVVLGGNKTLVFNAEYYFNIAGPVRALLFYDAGEVRDLGQPYRWWDPITEFIPPPSPLLSDFSGGILTAPGAPTGELRTIGKASAIKTSAGAELRFFMPVLNVPFRLIAAYNPQRFGVLNNKLTLTEKFVFRFAVGTTF